MVSIDIIYITGAKASNLRIVTKFFGQSQLNSLPDETIDRSHVTGRRKGLCKQLFAIITWYVTLW